MANGATGLSVAAQGIRRLGGRVREAKERSSLAEAAGRFEKTDFGNTEEGRLLASEIRAGRMSPAQALASRRSSKAPGSLNQILAGLVNSSLNTTDPAERQRLSMAIDEVKSYMEFIHSKGKEGVVREDFVKDRLDLFGLRDFIEDGVVPNKKTKGGFSIGPLLITRLADEVDPAQQKEVDQQLRMGIKQWLMTSTRINDPDSLALAEKRIFNRIKREPEILTDPDHEGAFMEVVGTVIKQGKRVVKKKRPGVKPKKIAKAKDEDVIKQLSKSQLNQLINDKQSSQRQIKMAQEELNNRK